MKHLKTYENNKFKKYILRDGINRDFGNSSFTIIYRVDEQLSYGVEATILYYLQNNIIQKSNSNASRVLNNNMLNTEVIYQSDNLEDVLEKMKLLIKTKLYNI